MVLDRILRGSSPRLWGTLINSGWQYRGRRFIPTLVGNTSNITLQFPAVAVHPHACGEHPVAGVAAASSNGSSPRLWGTRLIGLIEQGTGRFIPTLVGNTAPELKRYIDQTVHPHACGEHT